MAYHGIYTSRGSNYGGSTRGSRGSSNYRSTTTRDPTLPPDRDLMEGLGRDAVRTLSKPSVDSSKGDPVKPEDVQYLGSYNWVEEVQPTIIVPGSPPEWRNRPFPYRVRYDTGVRFVDQNGFRMAGESCLLPLFRAVDIVSEDNADTTIDWSAVDIVTDRNGLRKLMRWLQYSGADSGEPLKEFRIDLQLGGKKTVLMHRWEKRTREIATPPRSGCGINFERESTSPAKGCERSTGHHRIVQYDFDGLKMVVRFEVDACLPQPSGTTTRTSKSQQASTRTTSGPTDIDSLTDIMSSLNVASATSASPPSKAADITVIRAGTQVPQSSIVELTTRSEKYIDEFSWAEQYPQLLLSYTPHLFLAAHDRGTFERLIEHKLGSEELRNIENNARIQRSFRQLAATLRTVQELVKDQGQRGRLTLVCQPDGSLKVYKRASQQGLLADSELERFGV
ncbi:hypothetical protein OH76DRAFT_630773 [Lentinus brumalis]|uniref:Geranylgeranyl pyrophosphate synthetase n=1 Tax=Lentinus brumalis TaxID=2498619 RepID=A0A371D8F4_9APHY|nr:hypothetical protein OH76DRAFT_630773 [Polyporus brumalis]